MPDLDIAKVKVGQTLGIIHTGDEIEIVGRTCRLRVDTTAGLRVIGFVPTALAAAGLIFRGILVLLGGLVGALKAVTVTLSVEDAPLDAGERLGCPN